jgi:hypothetical protein
MVFLDGGRVIESIINLLNDQIDESQHDIESIETYIAKQDEGSISTEQVRLLRGLQDMYRQRIASLQTEISERKLRLEACTPERLAI